MGGVQGVKSLKVRDRKSKTPAEGNHQSESRLPSGGARLPSGGALKERPEVLDHPLPHPGAGVRPHQSSSFKGAGSKGVGSSEGIQLILEPSRMYA